MTDPTDTAQLRELAERTHGSGSRSFTLNPATVLSLLDTIAELETAVNEAEQRGNDANATIATLTARNAELEKGWREQRDRALEAETSVEQGYAADLAAAQAHVATLTARVAEVEGHMDASHTVLKERADRATAAHQMIASQQESLSAARAKSAKAEARIAELEAENAEYKRRRELNPLSGLSTDGINVWGDEKSMKRVRLAMHALAIDPELRGEVLRGRDALAAAKALVAERDNAWLALHQQHLTDLAEHAATIAGLREALTKIDWLDEASGYGITEKDAFAAIAIARAALTATPAPAVDLAAENARLLAEANAEVERWKTVAGLRSRCLGFFASVIKSGEPWTETCQTEYAAALSPPQQDGSETWQPCTCHPDDNPPRPCPQRFALSECRAAAPAGSETEGSVRKVDHGRNPSTPEFLDWLAARLVFVYGENENTDFVRSCHERAAALREIGL